LNFTGMKQKKEPGGAGLLMDPNRLIILIIKTDDMSTQYAPGPVEDPVTDPTIKGTAESLRTYLKDLGTPLPAGIEIPEEEERAEVPPDLLVEYGDGKTFFGGRGKKVIDNSEGSNISRKEMTFNWSVTRRKKPL